jgi:uncharacterized protein YjbI with pentapeptide repeats
LGHYRYNAPDIRSRFPDPSFSRCEGLLESVNTIRNKSGEVLYELDGGIKALSGQDFLTLESAVLSGEDMEGFFSDDGNFGDADFHGTDLYWATFFGGDFTSADLSNADLRGANLHDCIFSGSNLTNTDFGRDNQGGSTTIRNCDFSTAVLTGTNFQGAEWDSRTKFPAEFDPEAHGMVFYENPAKDKQQ